MCLHISHTCVYTYKEGNLTAALRPGELNTHLGLEEGFKTNSSFKQSLESSRGKGERGEKKNPTKNHTNKKGKSTLSFCQTTDFCASNWLFLLMGLASSYTLIEKGGTYPTSLLLRLQSTFYSTSLHMCTGATNRSNLALTGLAATWASVKTPWF